MNCINTLIEEEMMDNSIKNRLTGELPGIHIAFNEQMKLHTSLHIGGPADAYITPPDIKSIAHAMQVIRRLGLPSLPTGGGTNLLVRDGGIEGAVISLSMLKGIEVIHKDSDSVILSVGSGVPLQELIKFTGKGGYSGLEGLAGIPGFVGGAVAGNSGAYGYEMKDVLKSISIIDGDGSIKKLQRHDMAFRYRYAELPENSIVVSVEIELKRDESIIVSEKIRAFMEQKRKKQPIGKRSAGCVFKNPENEFAGKLIEEAGCKGLIVGDIEVSSIHANFFVNNSNGMAGDFLELMEIVSERVRKMFGIVLEPEIKVVGKQ